jgi:cytochrome c-type biogenesis protein CcmH/NrfG
LPEAVAAAREATARGSTDWRPWVVLSRLEAENGNPGAAVAAYRHAYSLFPRGLPGAS